MPKEDTDMKIRNVLSLMSLFAFSAVFTACSDSSGPNDLTMVTMEARLTEKSVSGTMLDGKVAEALGAEVDSIALDRVRVLVSRLKLKAKGSDDSTSTGDIDVKTGPMVIDADADTIRVFAVGEIPAGNYDKVKFEFHRFDGSQIADYLNDSIFGAFVTDDRWTVIVDGVVYNEGGEFPFTYRSDVTANLSLKFPEQIEVAEGDAITVVLEIDPLDIFGEGNGILDPRDGTNESKIDNGIKSAIKALKK